MSRYSIKDLEKVSGIKAHTIRIWEKRYNVIKPKRTDTNIRYYCDDDLKKLLNISILNRWGYRISIISKLSSEELKEKVLDMAQGIKDVDKYIENLIVATIEMSEEKFNRVINRALLKHGFERTFTNTIYPFYQKIKLLWQVGTVNLAQKYFICGLIKQKMLVAIDALDIPHKGEDTFILYLPEEENLELSLLFYYYSIRKRGFHVSYIGHSLPLYDLVKTVKDNNYKYVLTSFISPVSAVALDAYFKKISEELTDKTILVGGMEVDKVSLRPYPNICQISKYDDLKVFLEKLAPKAPPED